MRASPISQLNHERNPRSKHLAPMLSFEKNNSGVKISGTRDDLTTLAVWLILETLSQDGYATYATSEGVAKVEIQRLAED